MKLKFYDRLVLFFGALLTVVAGAALVVAGLQVAGTIGESLSLGVRIACIGVGSLTVIFGAYLMAFPQKLRAERQGFVVQRTDNGELRISIKAIEGLVQKCIDMHDEIDVVSQRIRNTRDGVTVDLNIALANNISIPLAVAALQKQIKQYLSASSGIEITEVRVTVDTAQMPAPENAEQPAAEAEQSAAEAPAVPEAEKPAPKAKIPLHQRIFGRSEAAANMPEPPKAEEAAIPAAPEAPEERPAEEPVKETEEKIPAPAAPAQEPEKDAEEAVEEATEKTVDETAEAQEEAADDTEETRNE